MGGTGKDTEESIPIAKPHLMKFSLLKLLHACPWSTTNDNPHELRT